MKKFLALPIIFSSATLSTNGDFTYMADSLGIKEYVSFAMHMPFPYKDLMKVIISDVDKQKKLLSFLEILDEMENLLLLFNNRKRSMI
ncbi:hypothetical protein KHA80_21165 [Anaerobacillus sp. HL2]|nr:hypothetical protein KHA80_21165 [Anaerobacillus sp. HL2]